MKGWSSCFIVNFRLSASYIFTFKFNRILILCIGLVFKSYCLHPHEDEVVALSVGV